MIRRVALLVLVGLLPTFAVMGQGGPLEPTLPVTALWAAGSRLLIGQGATLTEARVTPLDLETANRVRFAGFRIQSISTLTDESGRVVTLAIHNGGLTALTESGGALDSLPIGGERVIGAGAEAYIPAQNAGIRRVGLSGGRLRLIGVILTAAPAFDAAPDAYGRLWAAEGTAGLRAYDLRTPTNPPFTPDPAFPTAHLRVVENWLVTAGSTQIALYQFSAGGVPRLAGVAALPGPVTDLAVADGIAYVGVASGAEVAAYTLTANGPVLLATYGAGGAESRVAASAGEIYVASARLGLARLQIVGGAFRTVNLWPLAPTPENCSANAPTDPDPPNQSVQTGEQVRLGWRASCAVTFAVYINGTLATILDAATTLQAEPAPTPPAPPERERHAALLPLPPGIVTWQVVATDSAGRQAAGPIWRFEYAPPGWYATPPPPIGKLVFSSPPINLAQPEVSLAVLCGGGCVGGALIVFAAFLIGRRRL